MAAVIRHAVAEGWLLFRQRWPVSVTLALALAIPVCLAGFTVTLVRWLGPVIAQTGETQVVPVLLHPHMDDSQREAWMAEQAIRHPDWGLRQVPPEELAERLSHWFPYLRDLLERERRSLLPILVEITAPDLDQLDALSGSPAVIALGPRSPLRSALETVSTRVGWVLSTVSAVLLAAGALLAAVWVHLELFRHGDEIIVMRLVGATEAAVRGPFLVAIALPAVIAAGLAGAGTVALCGAASRLGATLGLPPVVAPVGVLAFEAVISLVLPLAAAAFTVARHAVDDSEG